MSTADQWRADHRRWWDSERRDPAHFLASEAAWIAATRRLWPTVERTLDPVIDARNSAEPTE